MTRMEGGCLCGAVRYAIELEEDDLADYCHCRECRRASGAPVVAWVQV
ncbi:GFA family protein, partial [Geminicoccus flavidas]